MENHEKIKHLNLNCIEIAHIIYHELKKQNKESPLRVQKILWYVQIRYFVEHSKLLFDDEFEAWNYGPVLKKVWANCPYMEKMDLNNVDENTETNIKSIIKTVIEKKANLFFFTLVEETHEQTPYTDALKNDKNNIITNESLTEYAQKINDKYLK